MTWHMVEQYGQPSPVEWMAELLGDEAATLAASLTGAELSELQAVDLASPCLIRVAALTYLLRTGWSTSTYRAFREPLLERLNDLDRVRAARVIEATLGLTAPSGWGAEAVLPEISRWLQQTLPGVLAELKAPGPDRVADALATLVDHCLQSRKWHERPRSQPTAARLAKLVRQSRRMLAVLELFESGLSEDWQLLRPSFAEWVATLERWAEVRRVARVVSKTASGRTRSRLRRAERRQSAQALARMAAIQSRAPLPMTINWSPVVQGYTRVLELIDRGS